MNLIIIATFIVVAILFTVYRLRGDRAPRTAPTSATPASRADVMRLIADEKFIEAIKQYRQITGLGLSEAKQAVDRMRLSNTWEAPPTAAAGAIDDEVLALVRANKLLDAVKLYQSKHGVDLTAAKQAVDKLAFDR